MRLSKCVIYVALLTLQFVFADPPDWQDNPGGYEFVAIIAGALVLNDGVQLGECNEFGTDAEETICIDNADIFAAFDDTMGVRGIGILLNPPFGPFEGTPVWEMTTRSNDAGDILSFKYYDASEEAILDITETYEFVINEVLGDVFEPMIFNVDAPDLGCPECLDDDSLVAPFTCATAVASFGCDFSWAGSPISELCPVSCDTCPIEDECGVCEGDGAIYECGCYGIPTGDCDCDGNVEDCDGVCGGSSAFDDCGVCDGGNADDLGCGCFEPGPSGCDNVCGSTLENDECGVCGGSGIPDDQCDCDGNVEDCAGLCGGSSVLTILCEDTDGDGLGNPGSETVECVDGERDITDGCELPPHNLYLTQNGSVLYNSAQVCEYCTDPLYDNQTGCEVSGNNTHGATWVIDINLNESECSELNGNWEDGSIFGFQFDVEGAIVISGSGGDAGAAGFMVSAGNSTVLAFSFSGSSIPPGCGTLVNLSLSGEPTGLSNIVVSGAAGAALPFVYYDTNMVADCSDEYPDCSDNYFDCSGECGGSAVEDECGVCGGSGIPDGVCDCDGNVDLGCGCGEAGPSGCDETCGSTLEFDECGVCGGDGIDWEAGECDCDVGVIDSTGGCCSSGEVDCNNDCGGTAVVDECGVCGGDGSSCATNSVDVLYSSDSDIAGFQFHVDGDLTLTGAGGGAAAQSGFMVSFSGSTNTVMGFSLTGSVIPAGSGMLLTVEYQGAGSPCLSDLILSDSDANEMDATIEDCLTISSLASTIDYCLSLHTGANLKSFYGLPEDVSVENVMSTLGEAVTGVITEGGASSQIAPGTWVGSISNILPEKGYWIIISNSADLCISEAESTNPELVYSLHVGANLISFPAAGSVLVSDALPDDIEYSVTGVITEGGAVSQISPGTWVGSMSAFNGGKGYWAITTEGIIFSFDLTNLTDQ